MGLLVHWYRVVFQLKVTPIIFENNKTHEGFKPVKFALCHELSPVICTVRHLDHILGVTPGMKPAESPKCLT